MAYLPLSSRPLSHPEGGNFGLLYEANPIAFITEQAGGSQSMGKNRILEIQPEDIHQRTALVVGSRVEMDDFQRCV